MTQHNSPGWGQGAPPPLPGYGQVGYAGGAMPGGPAPQSLQYATPFGYAQEGAAWREGAKLVTLRETQLPKLCVKCGAPADGVYTRRTFYWFNPLLYLALVVVIPFSFIGLLIFGIILLVVRKKTVLTIGLCPRHLARRRMMIALGWLLGLLGIAVLIGGTVFALDQKHDELAFLAFFAGVAILILGAVLGSTASLLVPTKMDDRYAWFKGAGPEYLNLFPPTY